MRALRRRVEYVMRMTRAGQATTEVVLVFPIFMFFLFAFAKTFALLILVQKLEIASFYAARRWQLESHRNANCEHWDNTVLQSDIQDQVLKYVGYRAASYNQQWGNGANSSSSNTGFLGLTAPCPSTSDCPCTDGSHCPGVSIQRTQVWQIVTVTACTKPINIPFFVNSQGYTVCNTKYVPNRDRPISFILPGLQSGSATASDAGCSGG